jgi:hypothetical protein
MNGWFLCGKDQYRQSLWCVLQRWKGFIRYTLVWVINRLKKIAKMSKKGNNFGRDIVDTTFHGFLPFVAGGGSGPGLPYI